MTTKIRRRWTAREKMLVFLHYGPLSKEPWTTRRIADATGRTTQQVRCMAKWWGRSWRDKEMVNYAVVEKYYRAGLSDSQVALMAGCAAPTVWRWRRDNKLRANRKSWGRPA